MLDVLSDLWNALASIKHLGWWLALGWLVYFVWVGHVHLEYYIFEPDHTGTTLRDALVERARAGVRVRLLVDAVGSGKLGRRFLAPLLEAGGEVAWFHPLAPVPPVASTLEPAHAPQAGRHRRPPGLCRRHQHHRPAGPPPLRAAYADLHLRLHGEIVRWLQLAFLEDWHYASGVALSDESLWPELPVGPIQAQVVPSGPDNRWEPIHRLQVEAIHRADRAVWLATPYFVPGEAGIDGAVLGGDARPGRAPAGAEGAGFAPGGRRGPLLLRRAAVGRRAIFEYQPRMMHAKALLVDADLCVVGSANFDHRSFRLNFELSVMFCTPGSAAELERRIEKDREVPNDSRELHAAAWRDLALPEALAEAASPCCSGADDRL
jgi:cardiolipin synthase A/B